MEILIRREEEADHDAVRALITAAFNRPDDQAEAKLVDDLRRGAFHVPELALVATVDDAVAGQILFSPLSIRDGEAETGSLALAPLSVLPAFQRQGVGTRLVQAGLTRAAELGFASVIVIGHPAYYRRFGFQDLARWDIRLPEGWEGAPAFGLELVSGSLAGVHGTLVYAPPFV